MWSGGITVALVTVEFLEVGLNTLSKAAMERGMSNYVFVLYSFAIGTIFLLLSTLAFHRLTSPPPPNLTLLVICKMSLLGLVSCFLQLFMFNGIGYGSPTLASAMINLSPAYTFILAIMFRMEKLDLKVKSSQAKSVGTLISVAGALLVTLYKGPSIVFKSSPSTPLPQLLLSPQPSWIIGGFVLAVASFFKSLLYIIQTWIIKDYPAELMVILISSSFATIIAAVISLIAETDPNAWQLRPDIELAITIGYSAIYGVMLRNVIHIWALRMKGPVFVTMFKPLGIVIAVIMGVTFLGDILYLGSVIGAVTIAVGFYSVVWGKGKEEKIVEDHKVIDDKSSSANAPLLQNPSMET